MLGHLVPCSGGKSIPLHRQRVYLGRRPQADKSLPLGAETALCRLRHIGGRWHADDLGMNVVRVNGRANRVHRVNPGDELTIGGMRFRMVYDAPPPSDEQAEAIAAAVLGEKPDSGQTGAPRGSQAVTDVPLDLRTTCATATVAPESRATAVTFQPAHLVPLGGGPDFLVSQPRVTIGRREDCDIVLPFSTVSGMHCGLEFVDGYWRVLDLGSRNGIRVDGVRCEKSWIYPDTRLSIADRRFELDYVPQGDRPEPLESNPARRKPLMASLGISQQQLDLALARHKQEEQEEPQRNRYDLLDNL